MIKKLSAKEVIEELRRAGDAGQARVLVGFFKTGKGEYGEGDKFFGVKVPVVRAAVKGVADDGELGEVEKLLKSEWHEARFAGAAILDEWSRRGDLKRRWELADFYEGQEGINNWDLVDVSAPQVLGCVVGLGARGRKFLWRLAKSGNLWRERMAVLATFYLIREGRFGETLELAEYFLGHEHDLMHKATGWMLREVGKRDVEVLRGFLREFSEEMPRTMLRYAIEKFPEEERRRWMGRE